MMKNNLEDFIQQNRALFDEKEPPVGHFERFQKRMDEQDKGGSSRGVIRILPWLMAAASIVLLFFVYTGNMRQINNAGIEGTPGVKTADYDESVWDDVIAINLKGVWISMKYQMCLFPQSQTPQVHLGRP